MSIDKRYVKQSVTGGERLRSQEKNGTQECMCIKKGHSVNVQKI